MLKKIINHKARIALTVVLVILLALIRAYEDSLFYDPFLNYFRSDFYNFPFPETDYLQLFFGLFFRYWLNAILSLAMIYVFFKDIDAIKFASVLYSLFFVVLILVFFYILTKEGDANKMGLFYVRRFLIQPVFLILFLPAFFYQKQNK